MTTPALLGRALVGTLLAALPLRAETPAPAEAPMPAAVGRITYGTDSPGAEAAICSGTLVAPDLVLTARHCVEKAWATPGVVRFQANAGFGQSLAASRGVEVILSSAPVTTNRANDVALLRLAPPIPFVTPLPLARDAGQPEADRYVAFPHDRAAPDQPATRKDCRPRGTGPGVLALSCPAVPGNSGAAVLIRQDGTWQIAAVLVASLTQDGARALAARVPADLRSLIPPARSFGDSTNGLATRGACLEKDCGAAFLSPQPGKQTPDDLGGQ